MAGIQRKARQVARKIRRKVRVLMGHPAGPQPEGPKRIEQLGHRKYVGDLWETVGRLQFDFLVRQGLLPSHCLLDIACGALRGGIHFIDYLDAGNYLGIDKEESLIETGIEQELGRARYEEKKPEFVVSDHFAFASFSKQPHFSIAQSLFTHLNARDISLCLQNLMLFVEPGHVLFATFRESASAMNPETSHSRARFEYTKEEMARFGEQAGWKATYLGGWNHPRNQMMMKYEAV